MPLFNIEGRTYQGANTFFQLVFLNIIFVICCLPVVTIGAASSALLEVMIKFSDNESGYLISGYFQAFKRNLGRGTAMFFIFAIPILLAMWAALFWFQSGMAGGTIGYAAGILTILLIVDLVGAIIFGFALVAKFQAPMGRTVMNALRLALSESIRTLLLVIIPVAMFTVAVVLPVFWILWLTIGFVTAAYVSAILIRQVFAKHAATGTDKDRERLSHQNPSILFGGMTSPHAGE